MKRRKNIHFLIVASLLNFFFAELIFAFLYFLGLVLIHYIQNVFLFFVPAGFEANNGIFNPLILAIYILSMFLFSIIFFFEIATIITITVHNWFFDDKIHIYSIFSFFRKVSKNLGKEIFFLIFIIFLVYSKIDIGFGLNFLTIPPYVLSWLLESKVYSFLLISFLFLILYFFYKGIFILHISIFEKNNKICSSYKKSAEIINKIGFKKNLRNFLLYIYYFLVTTLFVEIFLNILDLLISFIFINIPIIKNPLLVIIEYLKQFFLQNIGWVLFVSGVTLIYMENVEIPKKNFVKIFSFPNEKPLKLTTFFKKIFSKIPNEIIKVIMIFFISVLTGIGILTFKIETFSMQDLKIISHRGYLYKNGEEEFLENTISAIKNAKRFGANSIEIDVYQNSEGSFYLSHDPNLQRIFDVEKNISELNNKQIKFISKEIGKEISLLEEVFQVIKKEKIHIIIEAKPDGNRYKLEENLVGLIQKYDVYDLVSVHSISLEIALKIKKLDSKIQVGYTVFGIVGDLSNIPLDFFSIQETAISSRLIKNIHNSGKKVYIWTLNSTKNLERYVFMGIDGVITDEVEKFEEKELELQNTYKKNSQYIFEIFRTKIFLPRF